jgi:thiamine biosynthesis lipoprotein
LQAPAKGALDPALGLRFDVDGIAKGYILDRALQRARRAAPKASGIRIDIGGDAVYWGRQESGDAWHVDIADAKRPIDNQPGIARLRLASQAIAASGHHSRGYTIGRRQLSHILDPQDGWPLSYAPGATVVAADAATADALATALTVMPIRDGIALVDRIDGAAALVVSDAGIPFFSARWPDLLAPGDGDDVAAPAARVLIDYDIPVIDAARYRQPYLAMWIEDDAGQPVRQLHVLGDRSRWLSELPRWWRHYGRNDPAGALGIARPTRAPGRYTLAWDGRDDRGRSMPAGRYVLRVEAAREHGGHEDIALPFTLDGTTMPLQHQGRSEIGRLLLRYDKT